MNGVLLTLVAIALFWVAFKGRNILLSLASGGMNIGLWYYSTTLGFTDPIPQLLVLVMFGATAFIIFWRAFDENGKFRPQIFGADRPNRVININGDNIRPRRNPNQRETADEYRLRARRALNSHRR